jgi:hypothetical protein
VDIKPYQDLIASCIDEILAINNISLKLYFKTLQPLDFIEADNAVTKEAREEETGVKMSKQEFDDDDLFKEIENLGESEEDLLKEGWKLIDEREVNYDTEDALDQTLNLARVPKWGKSIQESEMDGESNTGRKYIVRYQYAPLTGNQFISGNTRPFCRMMVKAKKVYRKEDLDRESAANKELAPVDNGIKQPGYNLWLYKGGANCHHYWLRKTYWFDVNNIKTDPNNPKAEPIYKKAREKAGIKPPKEGDGEGQEPKIVSTRPIDTKGRGYKHFHKTTNKGTR